MFGRIFLSIAVLCSSVSLWSQVEPSATGGSGTTSDDDSMMTLPPPVSGGFFPSSVGSQARSNTLSGGVIVTASYDDNVLTGDTAQPISAETYTVFGNLRLQMSTPRTRGTLAYSPGFRFYNPTTELNGVNQNAVVDFRYRLSPHTTFSVQDSFQQNSTAFSEPYTLSGATISGSEGFGDVILLPYVDQVVNSTQGRLSYQFSRSSLLGASGNFSLFHFSNTTQSAGLYDSNSGGGTAFYSRRMSRSQYLGMTYKYSISETTPFPSTTTSQYGTVFYSVQLNHELSLSFSGGPEYSTTTSTGITPIHTWAPNGVASLGWQKRRANVAVMYARAVTTGWGLIGAYTTDDATANIQWQFSKRVLGGLYGNYANVKNATPQIASATTTGHTIFGRATLQYLLSERLTAVAEYGRFHEIYSGIAEVSRNPDDDRFSVSLNYSFARPLGR